MAISIISLGPIETKTPHMASTSSLKLPKVSNMGIPPFKKLALFLLYHKTPKSATHIRKKLLIFVILTYCRHIEP